MTPMIPASSTTTQNRGGSAREEFPRGLRVRRKAPAKGLPAHRRTTGRITGYSSDGCRVRVLWDGLKRPETIDTDFIEKDFVPRGER